MNSDSDNEKRSIRKYCIIGGMLIVATFISSCTSFMIQTESNEVVSAVVDRTKYKIEEEKSLIERKLSREELNILQEDLCKKYNGFFLSLYDVPTRINWNQVFYSGAGIEVECTPEQEQRYIQDTNYDQNTSLITLEASDVKDYVYKLTGTDYKKAIKPLTWKYYSDIDRYMWDVGDTNYQEITLLSGTISSDNIYRLSYQRQGDNKMDSITKDITMTVQKTSDGWRFISNITKDYNSNAEENGSYYGLLKGYKEFFNTDYFSENFTPDLESYKEKGINTEFQVVFSDYKEYHFENAMDVIGYYFKDLDKNGINELIIGYDFGVNEKEPNQIVSIYTLKNHLPMEILNKGQNDTIYLMKDGLILTENCIDENGKRYYLDRMNETGIDMAKREIYCEMKSIETGTVTYCHRTFYEDGREKTRENISKEMFNQIIASFKREHITYTKLNQYCSWQ